MANHQLDELSAIPLFLQSSIGPASFPATGFVVTHQGSNYLITNWHVVTGRNAESNQPLSELGIADPDRITIWYHSNKKLGIWYPKTELLLNPDDGSRKWLEHPLGRKVDVIALPLTDISDVVLYNLDLGLANTDLIVSPSEPVSILGFPLGMSSLGRFPIWKTGHVASEITAGYRGQPIFLVDATTKSGMSGSPVIARRIGMRVTSKGVTTGSAPKFLGVYSGRIHEAADIGMVWKSEVLNDILPK